jgi:hypothetical protein
MGIHASVDIESYTTYRVEDFPQEHWQVTVLHYLTLLLYTFCSQGFSHSFYMNTKRLEQFDERALQLKYAVSISGILGVGRESGPMFGFSFAHGLDSSHSVLQLETLNVCPPLDGYQFCFICLGKYHMSSQALERAHQDSSEALKVYDEAGCKHRTVYEGPGYALDLFSLDGPEWVVKPRCVSSSCSLFLREAGRYSVRLLRLCTITVFIH